MSPHSTSAPLYNVPPLDDQNITFLEWKPLFVSQADGHEFTQFYLNKAYVPSDLILSILDDDSKSTSYSVDADLTGDDLSARHKAIATLIQSVHSTTLKKETAKALSRLRALALTALTFLNSSVNNPFACDPAVLNAQSQMIKYHDGDCLDTLLAEVKSIGLP
ncbi:hypothetical protein H257_02957 [Aphanomyces astaci]|uniref:Uncharacterized protein n=1 Tax=Aphanomyces astaci TaxID=112090 RepID=W4H1I4_APHAT|nr:hypothetical protein H257_02957 [Aphanomyces astaci]ETV85099.1 hypothetical protein H257_02957 [Aphanomyces astaci]|eukprot:XP_009825117.1 hypothetical protein H257_02957 [Aphanomyces astaci]